VERTDLAYPLGGGSMVHSFSNRLRKVRAGLFCILLLAISRALLAQAGGPAPDAPALQAAALPDMPAPEAVQSAQSPAEAPAPAAAPSPFAGSARHAGLAARPESSGEEHHFAQGQERQQVWTQEGSLKFSLWDRSPLDAVARQERILSGQPGNSDDLTGVPNGFSDLNPGNSGLGVGSQDMEVVALRAGGRMGRGGMGGEMGAGRGYAPGQVNLNQLTRGSAGMSVSSSAGKFSLTYQDGYNARALGSGMGPGSTHATFTSTQFADGLFDFSSSFNFGSGTSLISTHSGFSAGVLHGSGVGASAAGPGIGTGAKRPTSSVSLKLSF